MGASVEALTGLLALARVVPRLHVCYDASNLIFEGLLDLADLDQAFEINDEQEVRDGQLALARQLLHVLQLCEFDEVAQLFFLPINWIFKWTQETSLLLFLIWLPEFQDGLVPEVRVIRG